MDLGQPGATFKGKSLDCSEGTVMREVDLGQPDAILKGTLPDCGEGSREMEDDHDIVSVLLDKLGILFARRGNCVNDLTHNFNNQTRFMFSKYPDDFT
jgi:hypothetical protein